MHLGKAKLLFLSLTRTAVVIACQRREQVANLPNKPSKREAQQGKRRDNRAENIFRLRIEIGHEEEGCKRDDSYDGKIDFGVEKREFQIEEINPLVPT